MFPIVVAVLVEVIGLNHLLVMTDCMDQTVGEALVQSKSQRHHVPLELPGLNLLLDLALVDGLWVDTERDDHFDLVLGQKVKPVGSSAPMTLLSSQPVEKEDPLPVIEGSDGPLHPVVLLNK